MRQIISDDGVPENDPAHVGDWLEANGVPARLVAAHTPVFVEDGILHFTQYRTVDGEGRAISTFCSRPVSTPWNGT